MSAAGLSVTALHPVALIGLEQRRHLPHHRRRRVRGRQDEPLGIEHAVVRLDRQDVLVRPRPPARRRRPRPPAPPFSSLVQSTTRTVRRGRSPSRCISRTASHAATAPPPSSIAPCPTSQESMWPPSDDHLVRLLPADHLGHHVARRRVGQRRARPSGASTTIGSPRSCNRCSIIASSTLSAAAGIFAAVES